MLIYYLDPKLVNGEPTNAVANALASALTLVGLETEVIIQGQTRAEIDGQKVSPVIQSTIDCIVGQLSCLHSAVAPLKLF